MQASSRLRVLVVDDYEPMRFLKSLVLSKAGHVVRQVASGREAIECVARERPDVVLLDVHLPDMDGLDVSRCIKRIADVPVIFASADDLPEDARREGDGWVSSLEPESLLEALQALPRGAAKVDPAVAPPCNSGTSFASSRRAPRVDILREAQGIEANGLLRGVLDALPCPTAILNAHRQIVFSNRAFAAMADASGDVLGQRPGEALSCIQAFKRRGGCGTSEFCQTCGAVRAMLEAVGTAPSVRECRMTRRVRGREEAIDLRVSVTPLNGGDYVVCAMEDVSDQKRRAALERIYFHDMLNTAAAMQGLARQAERLLDGTEAAPVMERIAQTSMGMLAEIRSQQDLLAAEGDDLAVVPQALSPDELAEAVAELYCQHDVAKNRTIVVQSDGPAGTMVTDRTLLSRVLGNMVKNALEATPEGSTVTLSCVADESAVEFHVHNAEVMPRETRLQVFQRSFSTRGPGRGLGTYSMKLLTERYLGGTIRFTSEPERGTTFVARYPRVLDAARSG